MRDALDQARDARAVPSKWSPSVFGERACLDLPGRSGAHPELVPPQGVVSNSLSPSALGRAVASFLLSPLAGVCILMAGAGASAQGLPTIHDAGRGAPIGALLAHALASSDQPGVSPLVRFPIESPGLVPHRLPPKARPIWPSPDFLTQTLFFIGDDPASLAWLARHRDALIAMRAAGMLVQVRTEADFKRVQRLAEGLSLAPTASQWLVQQLARVNAAVLPLLLLPDGTLTQTPPGSPQPAASTPTRPAP